MSAAVGVTSLVVLVTGSTGQVGHELVRELSPCVKVVAPLRADLDLADPASIRQCVRAVRPQLIVNAGAFTAVDEAETNADVARAVNAVAPAILADEMARLHGAIIHFSTDYVFDGTKPEPYTEDDATNPVSVYGMTKRDGERAVMASRAPHIVLRTSWVYSQRGHNFLRTILRLARERDELRVVNDRHGAPTWSRCIAAATAAIVAKVSSDDQRMSEAVAGVSGLYHLSAAGSTTWYDFARAILALDSERHEHRCTRVVPIASSEFAAAAARPANSRLACDRLDRAFGIRLPHWQQQLADAMSS
ncbi:MAG: dTDP-4-dehydrorhamnose reductase [bacterium]